MSGDKGSWGDAIKLLGEAAERDLDGPPDLQRLIAYQRGELSEAERHAVEERLDASREDARLLLDWQEFSRGTAESPAPAAMDAAWQRFEAAAQPPTDVPAASEPRRWWPAALPWAAAAALVFAVLALGWGLAQQRALREAREIRAGLETLVLGDALRDEPAAAGPSALFDGGAGLGRIEVFPAARQPRYRVAVVAADGEVVWSATLEPDRRGAVVLYLQRDSLPAGGYAIEVAGPAGPPQRLPFQIVR